MSTPTTSPPLTDDLRLQKHLEPILQTATRRQLWLFLLDADDRIAGPVIPIDDLPRDPAETVSTDDLGERPCAGLLGMRLAFLVRELGLAQIVLVWERRGGRELRGQERAWARDLGNALRDGGTRVRAQFLLHDRGMRVLAPDDLV